ncbi:MAG: hypothetical protein BroJett011_40630 [Chloroflexota bacterium]|nr:MAG: hypothetical protein BroJett011_40630 [Chloroflexota bacterium]
MLRPVSFLLTVVVLFAQLNATALLPSKVNASPCGEPQKIYLPILNAMSQPNLTEHLESIIRKDAAFPYDGLITQVFATTVNVMPVGSRTVLRDVALPAHISSDTIQIGYAVRLDQTAAKPTVLAIFEQFADPEMFNYAGLGVKVPANPSVTVKATKTGWLVSWGAVPGATKYILYKNDTPDGDSPEEVIQLGGSTLSYTVGYEDPFIYYAVKACSGYLESDVSLWMTDMTPPAAPTWKVHTYQTEGHYLEWTHTAPADVKEFIVYRNFQLGDQSAAEVTRTANLNTIVDYVNMSDYFGVQAVDWSGINKSAIVWWGPYDPTPATPANFAANLVEGGGYVCTWDTTTKAVNYVVQGINPNDELSDWTPYYNGPITNTPALRLDGITTFRVAAVGIDGSMSGWSAADTDDNPPPQPILSIVNGAKQVTVGLAANDTSHTAIGFSHYILETAAGSAGQGATTVDARATFDSFPRVFAGETGVTIYYRLTPVDWAGNVGTPTAWTPGTPLTFGDGGATIQDKFDTYGGTALTPIDSLYWLQLAKVEQAESWTFSPANKASWVSTDLAEGTKAIRVLSSDPGLGTTLRLVKAMNLTQEGRFTNDDYLVIQNRLADIGYQKVTITFYNTTGYPNGSGYQRTFDTTVDFGSPFVAKRSEFAAYGASPSWATIAGMEIFIENFDLMGGLDMTVDDIRIVKADPEDVAAYNDTGLAWDYARSSDDTYGCWEWHIYPGNRTGEPFKPFSFGQVNTAYGTPDQWYLAHKPIGTDVVVGTIQAGIFHKENGQGGLAFYIKDVSLNHWTMYAIETENVGDTVKLVKWVDGTRTELGSASFAFISAAGGTTGQTIWVGADFSEYDADGGRIKVYASTIEGNLIQASNLKISVQDTEIGSGGSVGLLSYQANVRFVNFTAGSPAHADVADVAKALDGPIVAGDVRRVHYNLDLNRWEYTDDGTTMVAVSAPADANKVDKTSVARPGVTRLYRRDNDSNYSVQNHYDGSRWWLRGYNGDTFHAECRVAYADYAPNATYLGGYDATGLKSVGSVMYRNVNLALTNGQWTAITWTNYLYNTGSYWNGATRLTAARTGWHIIYCMVNIDSNGGAAANYIARLLRNGGSIEAQHNEKFPSSVGNGFITLSITTWMTAGDYFETFVTISGSSGILNCTNSYAYMGLISLEA